MGYKPTLGGLKKAQYFLWENGFDLPIFQMHIYDKVLIEEPIDTAIEKYGAHHKVVNVCLTNKSFESFIVFSSLQYSDAAQVQDAKVSNWSVVISCNKKDTALENFWKSDNGNILMNLIIWGRPNPSFLDRILCCLFPKKYWAGLFL